MMFCPGCKKTKIDDQFIKYNRDGNKIPTRMCKFCRDRRVGYYEKKKLFRHDGRDWTIQMDLRSGRRMTLKRGAVSSTRTESSNKKSKPTPPRLPLEEGTRITEPQSAADTSPPARSEPSHCSLPASLFATESIQSSPKQAEVQA